MLASQPLPPLRNICRQKGKEGKFVGNICICRPTQVKPLTGLHFEIKDYIHNTSIYL
jgi:hypothetical protein